MAAMQSLAVVPIATGVLRAELLQMRQFRDEPFRTFVAQIRGKAETCSFSLLVNVENQSITLTT